MQTTDEHKLDRQQLNVVTERKPSDEEIQALLFAWIVCKHTKSNAIVYARADQTVGVGAGQMSRVDSVKIGAMRAQLPVAVRCSRPMRSSRFATASTKLHGMESRR